jgi:hypothetical protein
MHWIIEEVINHVFIIAPQLPAPLFYIAQLAIYKQGEPATVTSTTSPSAKLQQHEAGWSF